MGKRNSGRGRIRYPAARGAGEAGPCRETSPRAFLRCATGHGCPCRESEILRSARLFSRPCLAITEFIQLATGRPKAARHGQGRYTYLHTQQPHSPARRDPRTAVGGERKYLTLGEYRRLAVSALTAAGYEGRDARPERQPRCVVDGEIAYRAYLDRVGDTQ